MRKRSFDAVDAVGDGADEEFDAVDYAYDVCGGSVLVGLGVRDRIGDRGNVLAITGMTARLLSARDWMEEPGISMIFVSSKGAGNADTRLLQQRSVLNRIWESCILSKAD